MNNTQKEASQQAKPATSEFVFASENSDEVREILLKLIAPLLKRKVKNSKAIQSTIAELESQSLLTVEDVLNKFGAGNNDRASILSRKTAHLLFDVVCEEIRNIFRKGPSRFTLTTDKDCAFVLIKRLLLNVTRETVKHLLPFNVIRHSTKFPFDQRAREDTKQRLRDVLGEFGASMDKLYFPFILVLSMPRQGKTLFLDCVGNDESLVNAWKGSRKHIFIFNVTFNANWTVSETNRTLDTAFAMVAQRLVGAALGIFVEPANSVLSDCNLLRFGNDTNEFQLLDVVNLIQARVLEVASAYKKEPGSVCWMFLFDEITKVCAGMNQLGQRSFYSGLGRILNRSQVAVISGFNRSQSQLSHTGRSIADCTLIPITDAQRRRSALALTTAYFQVNGINRSNSDDVLFHYELAKASPGVLGAILQNVARKKSILGAVAALPIIDIIGKNPTEYSTLLEQVLQWKAVQFCGHERFTALMNAECAAADAKNIVRVGSAALDWNRPPTPVDDDEEPKSSREVEDSTTTLLGEVQVETLFVQHTFSLVVEKKSWMKVYMAALRHGFCGSIQHLDSTKPKLSAGACSSHFNLAKSLLSEKDQFELLLGESPFDEKYWYVDQNNRRKLSWEALKVAQPALCGAFFEDGVACGICYQKENRLALARRLNEKTSDGFASSLDFALPSCEPWFVTSGASDINITWQSFSSNSDQTPKLCFFTGKYPHPDGTPANAPNVTNSISGNFEVADETFTEFCDAFQPHLVLRPKRPESNSLADIIFHEKLSGSSPGLVQFWIDTKHSHERQHHVINKRHGELLPAAAKRFATQVWFSMSEEENPRLHQSSVKHVVHIIISPAAVENDDEMKNNQKIINTALQSQLGSGANNKISYSLYVVHPDSLAFENLVSQPIRRSLPLMELQQTASWCQRLGAASLWKSYRATTKSGLDGAFAKPIADPTKKSRCTTALAIAQENFCEWRGLRLEDECISTLSSFAANRTLKEELLGIVRNSTRIFSAETLKDDQKSLLMTNVPNEILRLPFGCVLQRFGIVVPGATGTGSRDVSYLSIDGLTNLKYDDEKENSNRNVLVMKYGLNDVFVNVELTLTGLWSWVFPRAVSIGGLVDGSCCRWNDNDRRENDTTWSCFFAHDFLTKFSKEVKGTQNSAASNASPTTTPTDNEKDVKLFKEGMIAGTIWNASIQEWKFADDRVNQSTTDNDEYLSPGCRCCIALLKMSKSMEEMRGNEEKKGGVVVFAEAVQSALNKFGF